MQVTDEMVAKAVEAWYHDWRSGPPEQNEISAMRAALTAALAKAWRPIEEAPRDVGLLLGWWASFPANKWEMVVDLYGCTKGGWLHGQATHWMPLPEPPATKEGE